MEKRGRNEEKGRGGKLEQGRRLAKAGPDLETISRRFFERLSCLDTVTPTSRSRPETLMSRSQHHTPHLHRTQKFKFIT